MAAEHSVAELGDLFGVTRSTVYRALQRDWYAGRRSFQSDGAGRQRVVGNPLAAQLRVDHRTDRPPAVVG